MRRGVLTWHDGLLALLAPGRVLVGVAVRAEQLVLLGGERLVHQGALAAGTVEAVLVPVPFLIGQVLQIQTQSGGGGAGGAPLTAEGPVPTWEADGVKGQRLWAFLGHALHLLLK